MSSGRRDTRLAILEAARKMFEAQGYFGAGLEAVAKEAGVSRQAIYLHFASKPDLLTALHLYVFEVDVAPSLERHPIWTAPTALDALDDSIAADAETASRVWRIHEALVLARRHHPEVDQTLRPREAQRYDDIVRLGRWLEEEGWLPAAMPVATFADVYWGLTSSGTFVNLVIERGWSVERFARWVRDVLRLQLSGAVPAGDQAPTGSEAPAGQ